MKHFDEHTLELFVLNAPEAAPLRREIGSHLLECHGCRELVEEMEEFHASLKENLESSAASGVPVSDKLARRWPSPLFVMEEGYQEPVAWRGGAIGKFVWLVRKHPVAAASGIIGTSVLLGFALSFLLPRGGESGSPADTGMATFRLNEESNTIDLLNRSDQLLWKLAVNDSWKAHGLPATKVALGDLHGDGKMELVTVLPLVDFPSIPGRGTLRIFDDARSLVRFIQPVEKVPYPARDSAYSAVWSMNSVLLRKNPQDGMNEIFASANSEGRSPCIIFRFDGNGKVLGEYHHFGDLSMMLFADLRGDGKEELLLGGVNDVDDANDGEFGVFVVLDPDKIVGKTRSSVATVYNLEVSDAEEYYVKFPLAGLDELVHSPPYTTRVESFDRDGFNVVLGSGYEGKAYYLYYRFDRSMGMTKVLSDNTTDHIYNYLASIEKVKSGMSAGYLERLRDEVRYWDGSRWSPKNVRVSRNRVASR